MGKGRQSKAEKRIYKSLVNNKSDFQTNKHLEFHKILEKCKSMNANSPKTNSKIDEYLTIVDINFDCVKKNKYPLYKKT